MDLRKWVNKLKTPQAAQPLVTQQLPNGTTIPSVTEDVQDKKRSKNLMG